MNGTMKQNCHEELRYQVALKKGYRILYRAMSAFFLGCTLYFGAVSFCADKDTMLFAIGITGVFLTFLFRSLCCLTKKCERYKGKVIYSILLKKREYPLSDIVFFKERTEEVYADHGDGNVAGSWDRVTTFYNRRGEKIFKFGLAYDNVHLLAKDVQNIQKSISQQRRKK